MILCALFTLPFIQIDPQPPILLWIKMQRKKKLNHFKKATWGDDDARMLMQAIEAMGLTFYPTFNESWLLYSATWSHFVQPRDKGHNQSTSAFSKRLTLAECCNSKAEDDILGLSDKEKSLQKKVQELTLKLDNLENRHRNSNLGLTGLPKKAKDGDVVTFLQTLLPKSLDQTPPNISF